ncbi:MAG: hypothetical protein Q8P60_15960 [Pseudorhodobacter sp.]|nr:hypothetical protein [Pseudorhodobacter sp.]
MEKQFSADEVAILIRARKIIKEKGLPKDIDVSSICDAAGISRKTGYEWESKLGKSDVRVLVLQRALDDLKEKHADLAALYKDVRFENEGRKAAWFIHGVDKLLAGKKNTTTVPKKPVR